MIHYLTLIGEQVSPLQHDIIDLKLTKTIIDVAFSALDDNSPAFIENYSNPGSSTGTHDRILPGDCHYALDNFLGLSAINDLLPQTGSNYDAAASSSVDLLPAQDWASDIGAHRSSSSRAIDMTTCLVCNQYHPTSDLCPYCFGQPLSVAASSEVISQRSLD